MSRVAPAVALLIASALPSGTAATSRPSAQPLPADIRAFIARRDRCDHFRGEDSDDPARRQEIGRNLELYCAGTDAALARLKARYRRNGRVVRLLSRYDPKVE